MTAVALGGPALHAGISTAVVLVRRPGPIAFRQAGVDGDKELGDLRVVRTDAGVAVASGSLLIDLMEHLASAMGGMGVIADLRVDVYGPEIPLLDGGALRFARALSQLGFSSKARASRILKPAHFAFGDSSYRFEPSDKTRIAVDIAFDHPLVHDKHAVWHGDPTDYLCRVSKARTFGFRRDGLRLQSSGRARAADLRTVVVLDDDGSSLSNPPPLPDECARHKLLDLIGDLTLGIGVPVGVVEAIRPGHGPTHRAIAMARAAGVFGT